MENKTCNDCKLSRPSSKINWVKCAKKHNDLKLATAPQCETPYITHGDIIRNMSDKALAEKLVYNKMYMVQDGILQYWVSAYFSTILPDKSWEYESEAIEATLEKLKEEVK